MHFPIIYAPFLRVNGMALFPFILVRHKHLKQDSILINHEKIHLRQQVELLVIPFYLLYLLNYLFSLAKYKNHHQAYFNIVFEKEAYAMETDRTYLNRRKLFAWSKFL